MTHPLTPREKVERVDLKLVVAHTMVEELRHQHPGLEQIDNERGDLWLPGGCTPQSAGCVIDLHAIAASVEREMDGFLKSSYQAGWNDREGDFLVGCDRVVGRTALASGSGDHAELAGLAERCTSGDPWYKDGDLRGRQSFGQFLSQDRAFIAAASPATVLALLAENAALREEVSDLREHRITADLLVSSLKSDKEEAERKLAEAEAEVRRWKSAYDIAHEQATENGSAANTLRGKLAGAVQVIRDVAETPYTGTDWPRSRAATYLASKEAERG